MEATLDTLTVRASAADDLAADKADLIVTIRGASLVTGSAALKKAREVRQLVQDLGQIGIPESAVALLAVTAETTSSVIGKSSSARYQLRIRCAQLDDLADVLGVITAQKNTQLSAVIWAYPDLAPAQDALLQRSLARAQAQARLMAAALGCQIAGVHAVSETLQDPEDEARPQYAPAMQMSDMARGRGLTADDLGFAVSHTKRLTVAVEVIYHIRGPLERPGGEAGLPA